MKARAIAYVLIVAGILAMMAASLLQNGSGSSPTTSARQASGMQGSTTTVAPTAASNTPQRAPVFFSSTPYYPYAYQIFPGNMSQQARAAMSGFALRAAALPNGSTNVTISLMSTSQNQSIVLGQGYSLYIIETTFGDDGYNAEYSLGDDGFIVVNQSGYVV